MNKEPLHQAMGTARYIIQKLFPHSLRKQRYKESTQAAKHIESLVLNQSKDFMALDEYLRKVFTYKPGKVAAWGYYPVLGMLMEIQQMHDYNDPTFPARYKTPPEYSSKEFERSRQQFFDELTQGQVLEPADLCEAYDLTESL